MKQKKSFAHSVSQLKTTIYQKKRKRETKREYEKNFSNKINNVKKQTEKTSCGIGVIGPAAYILKMGDTKIAIDPCLWEINITERERAEFIELINSCDGVIITHHDSDHYDVGVLDALDSVALYIPDFLDYQGNSVIPVSVDESIVAGDCKITFFEGAHTADRIVPEYGFAVTYCGKSYVFPADVRDYKKPHPVFENTDVLVAHLWLGKENALNLYDNPYMDLFCNFVNGFGTKRVLLGHVLDFRRTVKDMWSEIHYKAIKGKIPESRILKLGDFVEF